MITLGTSDENPLQVAPLKLKHTVHASQELRNYSALHLALCALSFWCDCIDLVNEQQRRRYTLHDGSLRSNVMMTRFFTRAKRTYLGLLKSFAQRLFRLA